MSFFQTFGATVMVTLQTFLGERALLVDMLGYLFLTWLFVSLLSAQILVSYET